MDIKMGSDFYCRICGQRHGSCEQHKLSEISPALQAQIHLENLELFISNLQISKTEREFILGLLIEYRKETGIPIEKIFLKQDPRQNPIAVSFSSLNPEQFQEDIKSYEMSKALSTVISERSQQIVRIIIKRFDELTMTKSEYETSQNLIRIFVI